MNQREYHTLRGEFAHPDKIPAPPVRSPWEATRFQTNAFSPSEKQIFEFAVYTTHDTSCLGFLFLQYRQLTHSPALPLQTNTTHIIRNTQYIHNLRNNDIRLESSSSPE